MLATSKNNINVAVRIRPLLPHEIKAPDGDSSTISIIDDSILLFDPKRRRKSDKKQFTFDTLFDEKSSQLQVFEKTAKPLIPQILKGYNCTVFAYGATGCGKTHTITGSVQDPGIIYMTVKELYAQIQRMQDETNVEMTISFLEVYNETIRDLLQPNNSISQKGLDLREDDTRVQVAGLSELVPRDLNHVMNLLLKGNEQRTKAFTAANAASSRSHAILQLHVKMTPKLKDSNYNVKTATLSIIDLAGSERASATLNQGARLNEGANINRSLLALGNCINALCSAKPTHIPFRDSKLTRLLKYSLSGNCRVVMIANISPAVIHAEETLNTLKYANRAKEIKTKVSMNVVDVAAQIQEYPKIIKQLREEITRLQNQGPQKRPLKDLMAFDPAVFEKRAAKADKWFKAIQEKQEAIIECQSNIKLNEFKMDSLKGMLITINKYTALLPERRDANDLILALNESLDEMHGHNTVYHHNAGENQKAIDRFQSKIDSLSTSKDSVGMKNSWEMHTLRLSHHYQTLMADKVSQSHEKNIQDISTIHSSLMEANISLTLSNTSVSKQQLTSVFTTLMHNVMGITKSESIELDDSLKSINVPQVDYDSSITDISMMSDFDGSFSQLQRGSNVFEEEQENLDTTFNLLDQFDGPSVRANDKQAKVSTLEEKDPSMVSNGATPKPIRKCTNKMLQKVLESEEDATTPILKRIRSPMRASSRKSRRVSMIPKFNLRPRK